MGASYDFSGWATRNDIKCSDGRVIRKDAFKDCDGLVVPLVWNHDHNNATNVLGHALLENREDGVYTYGSFNDTEDGVTARKLVQHGDITHLSIYANKLTQKGHDVIHGAIREVSLVLAGANPGAYIDTVIAHSDTADEEAIISIIEDDTAIEHSVAVPAQNPVEEATAEPVAEPVVEETKPEPVKEEPAKPKTSKKAKPKKEEEEVVEHADSEDDAKEDDAKEMADEKKEKTVGEVFDTLTPEQKTVVYALIGQALEEAGAVEEEGDEEVKHNVFESDMDTNDYLSHAEMDAIFSDAKRGGSLREAVIAHGIEDIDYLFPEAKAVNGGAPEFIKRQDAWVTKVMNGVHHTPFSRIKSVFADITEADARAKGYLKGNYKKEELFGLLKRTTSPTTVYKKQKLDRDDQLDIVDFDVVAWIKNEMRMMLDEELARAILVGDGRSAASDEKINEQCIRPIWTDDDIYTVKKTFAVAANATADQKAKAFIQACVRARKDYRGSGDPVLFTTEDMLTNCLLMEDQMGRIIYDTQDKLANTLRVREIVTAPVLENLSRAVAGVTYNLQGIIVNLRDYNVGADKGGAVNMFDDFDIDYNAQKYLIETRCSGALIKPYSAIAIEMTQAMVLTVEPETANTTILGKAVSDLQDGVIVNDNFIQGHLKYVTGYTGYSQDTDKQSGNYLALKFEATSGATTTVELVGGEDGPVTLDQDMNCVIRIENKNTQKVKVVSTLNGETVTKVYSLASLVMERP